MSTALSTALSTPLSVVILAAGQGKRMKSTLPKVLHPLAGRAMLSRVLDAANSLKPRRICVVHGHGGDQVLAHVKTYAANNDHFVSAKQEPQLGTGHAVLQAMPQLPLEGVTLVLYADVPLISHETLQALTKSAAEGKLAWLTQKVADPKGLGRMIRDKAGKLLAIIEDKDATPAQREITEINTGFLACPTAWLAKWLPTLGNKNAQGEYYLTDILALAVNESCEVVTHAPLKAWETTGVNSRDQLAALERIYQRDIAERLMVDGVTLADPTRIDVRGTLVCAQDVDIDISCIFEGKVALAQNVKIGANCILRDCTIATGAEILPYSFIDGATIGDGARIGPYARIRPGTTLANDVHIGNFVEVKASDIGVGSKANHLSYIGDTTIGRNVNVGAGTITCNYDGANKHRTVIEDNVHVGSDVQLVAPVTIREGTTIAAGTTVWKDTNANELTMNAKTQISKTGYVRPAKKTLKTPNT
jgi:bifunctional UDP-N-acetylglucosamine pyrophosphorylase / glucosamine-1-phosphate N-acetyltransferase